MIALPKLLRLLLHRLAKTHGRSSGCGRDGITRVRMVFGRFDAILTEVKAIRRIDSLAGLAILPTDVPQVTSLHACFL